MDLRIPDHLLLADCRVETFRGPGPGGQKRNKTSSAVRITHLPTGITASAAESRSQHQNRRLAVRRLRLNLAMQLRSAVDLRRFQPPGWLIEAIGQRGLCAITPRSELYPAAASLVLDLLSAAKASMSLTAQALGISTGSLSVFLTRDRHLLAATNACRRAHGLKPINARD